MIVSRLLAVAACFAALGAGAARAAPPWDDRSAVQEIRAYDRCAGSRSPEGFQEKCTRMAASPFAFFRGSSHLFYRDLALGAAGDLVAFVPGGVSATWIQGDCHAENFGVFEDGKGRVVYDIQDFDEAIQAPWIWDLARLAASFALARDAHPGPAVRALAASFARTLRDPAEGARVLFDGASSPKPIRKMIEKVVEKGREALLEKDTALESGKRRFRATDRLTPLPAIEAKKFAAAIRGYAKTVTPPAADGSLGLKDVASKISKGVASVGLGRWLLLVEGPTASPGDDVILELKEQCESALAPYVAPRPPPFSNEGERYVAGARAMQGDPDRWLGWTRMDDRDFVIREQSPYKKALELEKLESDGDWKEFAEVLGALLGRSMSRSGAAGSIAATIAGREARFEEAVDGFARKYAARARADWAEFRTWHAEGGSR